MRNKITNSKINKKSKKQLYLFEFAFIKIYIYSSKILSYNIY